MRIGEVAQPVPLRRSFDYEVPEALRDAARPGARVRAPFGPRRLTGVLLSVREGFSERPLKPLDAVLDPEPLLSGEILGIARWLAARYFAPIGECVKALLPAFVNDAAGGPPMRRGPPPDPPESSFELTPGQGKALATLQERLRAKRFGASLLYGVPASGKTEVYLRLMREAVQDGGQALYLLPEISLTRPFFDELDRRAGFSVALWHSRLGIRQRRAVWLGLRSGAIAAVVGARSAALLPFRALRLAVVDEEQDESFKQEGQPPLYHARDLILERARRSRALAVFGSATPSMEAMAKAAAGEWDFVEMPERVAATARPRVEIVARPPRAGACLTEELAARIRDRVGRREQVILLVNRRGFSNFVVCRACGWVARCKACALAFVHHEDPGKGSFHLRCHHCGRRTEVPAACGACKEPGLAYAGIGTQKVAAELRRLLPGAKVLRMDRDTVSRERAQESRIYDQFRDREADVLIGTKLVAKGFHFPDVTLVGVADADTMLRMPDFRAAERTVQLLMQAAGRSGRAEKPGEVLLQTAQPEHYAIQSVARGDYLRYCKVELAHRRELGYPPAAGLVRLVAAAPKEEAAEAAAEGLARALRAPLGALRCEVLGPSPAVRPRQRGRWRWHLLLKLQEPSRLGECLAAIAAAPAPKGIRLRVDVDPYDLF